MRIETFFWLAWSLTVAALLLGLLAVGLAWRGVGPRVWVAHGLLSAGVGVVLTAAAQAAIYQGYSLWWQTGAGYLATFTVPPILAGWVGRWVTKRWPARPRWQVGAAVVGALVVAGGIGARAASGVLPPYDLIQAVQ